MRVAIVGSRDYPDLAAVRRFVRELPKGAIVVSGGARGVDRTAAGAAKRRGLRRKIFKPNRAEYGDRAYYVRNKQIARYADVVCTFWDGRSRGTPQTSRAAAGYNKLVIHLGEWIPAEERQAPSPGLFSEKGP